MVLGVEWHISVHIFCNCDKWPDGINTEIPSAFVRISGMGSLVAKGHVAEERCVATGRTMVGIKSERYKMDERTTGRDESVLMDGHR